MNTEATVDIAKLKAAAEKATQGQLVVGHSHINEHGNLRSVFVCQEWNGTAGGVVAECHVNCLTETAEQARANAEFFALASPAAILNLIAAFEDAQRSNEALAAENAAARDSVQVFCDVVGDNTDAICEVIGKDGVMAILSAMRATGNLPATDAFLCEVKAQGADAVCLKISNSIVSCRQDEMIGLDAAVNIASDFAAQLRQGGAA
ncbi:ead/Ea22-like family protein [Cronobacter sakazakii]